MIQINLVPDVKRELLQARSARTRVVSGAIVIGLVSIGLVTALALYVFGAQTVRTILADNAIDEQSRTLAEVPDLANTLTIQQQLATIGQLHDVRSIDSRIFDLLVAVNPPAPDDVKFSNIQQDASTRTIRLEGQAVNGYGALERFKKTLQNTSLRFRNQANEEQTRSVAEQVSITDTSYGEDADGRRVVRFVMTVTYPEELFMSTPQNVTINPPSGRENATDSSVRVPGSIFTDRASDVKEGR